MTRLRSASDEADGPTGPVVIIGAGPAGLTAAYELTRLQIPVLVVDQDRQVGGLAQTVCYKGFKFDIGGHRFYTKIPAVQALWREMIGPDLLRRPRLSRIYYRGRFFEYPISATNALGNLGVTASAAVLLSYCWAQLRPIRPEVSFRDWVSNRFGRRLFRIFFESYTEKVWGIPCDQISARWAAQRIRGLSLRTAIVNMLTGGRATSAGGIRSLIHEFEYPRLGPGMMWEAFRDRIEAAGGRVQLGTRVIGLVREGGRITRVVVERDGERTVIAASHVIATMPVRELVNAITPALPRAAREAANCLQYRDFITVALVVRQRDVFPDNWIYVHDPAVKVGRIQNFKNWSPDMVPDPEMTCVGMEYFCSDGDALWSMTDDELVALAGRELAAIGLVAADRIVDGTVVRARKAYPVYDGGYGEALAEVRRHVDPIANLQLVGRNGTHTYNNQDHSMVSAMLAVRNLLGERHDLWADPADRTHHEELSDVEFAAHQHAGRTRNIRLLAATQPLVPMRLTAAERLEAERERRLG